MKKHIYDYYNVTIELEMTDSVEMAGHIAIGVAKERTRLYCTPSNWEARLTSKSVNNWFFRVRRVRNRVSKQLDLFKQDKCCSNNTICPTKTS